MNLVKIIRHKDYCDCGCAKETHNDHHNRFKIIQIIFGAVFIVLGMIFEEKEILSLIFFICSYLIVGIEVLITAFRNLIKGKIFDECFLMSIATICAFIAKEYDEAVIVMELFQIGEFIEDIAVTKTHNSVEILLSLNDYKVHRLCDDKIIDKEIDEICLDDEILIYDNERVLLDGIVLEGQGEMDISSLVGKDESQNLSIGQNVYSGSIYHGNKLKLKVSKTYNHSTVHQILEIIDSKTISQTKSKKFVEKFSKIYTPIVVFGALIVAIIPPLFFKQQLDVWLYKACLLLVVSCPCAIVISIPLAYYINIGVNSRVGILNKGINYLDMLNNDSNVQLEKSSKINSLTIRIVYENIISVIIVKVAAMIWGIFGELPMWAALISDTGICLLCILNCLRLFILLKRKGE